MLPHVRPMAADRALSQMSGWIFSSGTSCLAIEAMRCWILLARLSALVTVKTSKKKACIVWIPQDPIM